MSEDDKSEQMAHPTDKTKYKVDASEVVIRDLGATADLKAGS